jgi:spermidine synthase
VSRRRRAAPELLAATGELAVLRDPRRPTGRLLRQADMDASYVDLADPRHLEFDYLRWMAAVAEAVATRDIVHVGAAGGALARALAASVPSRHQELVEVEPAVVELARAHLGLRRAPGLRVRTADGRAALARRGDGSADAVLVDAFVGARVPRHLVSAEALADLARVVAPAGVVAINVVDGRGLPDTRAIGAGLRASFGVVAALGASAVLHGRRAGNVVLVAGHGPLPLRRIRAAVASDRSPALLLEPDDVAGLCGGTAPWHDESGAPGRS